MARGTGSSYLLITPVKNEERYIGECIESVVGQTAPPSLWVIVDDGSTDGSVDVVRKWTDSHSWIELLSLGEGGEWDLGIHYSEVCMRGFDQAVTRARENGISWEFIGLVDGDIRLDHEYFERILEEMRLDNGLGIASGHLGEPRTNGTKEPRIHEDKPMGGARLWRRKCFGDAPFITTFAPDSVSNIKAQLKGWNTRLFHDIKAEQMRPMGTGQGRCQGAVLWGRSSHYLGSTPMFAFLKGIRLLVKYPFYIGPCYWKGYFASYLFRKDRIDDQEILDYYRGRIKRSLSQKR